MEKVSLSDFISESIHEISQGMKDAQNACEEDDVIVNPVRNDGIISETAGKRHKNGDNIPTERPVQNVTFDVSVTISSESNKDGKVGLIISILDAHLGGNVNNMNTAASRISFNIPVCFPVNYVGADKHLLKETNGDNYGQQ